MRSKESIERENKRRIWGLYEDGKCISLIARVMECSAAEVVMAIRGMEGKG